MLFNYSVGGPYRPLCTSIGFFGSSICAELGISIGDFTG